MKVLERWRINRWEKQKANLIEQWARLRAERMLKANARTLVFHCEEFFHNDLRGFGGLGKTVKNIANCFNDDPEETWRVALAYSLPTKLVSQPTIRNYHNTPVVLRPPQERFTHASIAMLDQYGDLLTGLAPRLQISIDWYPSYEIPCYSLGRVPLIIWIHDPRDAEEWKKIGVVPGELAFRGLADINQLIELAAEKAATIGRMLSLRNTLKLKTIFATTAHSLLPLAQRTYGIPKIKAHWLPIPIEIPVIERLDYSEKPSLLFLGRLDVVKRPWITFELARRFPQIDFYIAGKAHQSDLMDPWLKKYADLPNLKLLGHVDGDDKDRLLRTCWGIINTSVHEALPVSFLEAFAYGRCVIACHDPDGLVSEYGYPVGEISGEGLDDTSLARFEAQIHILLENHQARIKKGEQARAHMMANYTYQNFKKRLSEIMKLESV